MNITPNGKWLFTGSFDGHIKQWSVDNNLLLKDYGKVHNGWIYCSAITPDGLYLFTGGDNRHLKQWSINHQTLWKDYGCIHN